MYKVIACSIFQPYIHYVSFNKEQYHFTYLDIQQHDYPQHLAELIQEEINRSQGYDKIIILYGVCGGALLSLETNHTPLILVKVHDCMSILLGSKLKYEDITQNNKSIQWSCYSLKKENKQNDDLLKWKVLYDEETVAYLKSVLIPNSSIYITFHLSEEKEFLDNQEDVIEGEFDFLEDILLLKSKDILTLYPKQKIKLSLDDEVIEVL